MKNKYQYWNGETREKSTLGKGVTLQEAINCVETEIALAPRDNDDDGWRIEEIGSGIEMTLAEAREAAREASR